MLFSDSLESGTCSGRLSLILVSCDSRGMLGGLNFKLCCKFVKIGCYLPASDECAIREMAEVQSYNLTGNVLQNGMVSSQSGRRLCQTSFIM